MRNTYKEEKKSPSLDLHYVSRQGFILHDDTGATTTEGLGSHARGMLYPFLQIALSLKLTPLFSKTSTRVRQRNRGRDYSKLDIEQFLEFDQIDNVETELYDRCDVIEVNTWTDPIIGSACGDPGILVDLISHYLWQRSCKDCRGESNKPILIWLYGALKYTDPCHQVLEWLQSRSATWKYALEKTSSANNKICFKNKLRSPLRVAIHIRVPEKWCNQQWKDDNHICHFLKTLEMIRSILSPTVLDDSIVDVFTEESFSKENETHIKNICPNAAIHIGSNETIPQDLKTMACSDILIVSSSHFSAFAGYLCTKETLIVLANDANNDYFTPHIKLGCNVSAVGWDGFESAVVGIYRKKQVRDSKIFDNIIPEKCEMLDCGNNFEITQEKTKKTACAN